MNNDETYEHLKKVCCDIFEQLAFMFGEELEDDEIESDAETFMRGTMSYTGAKNGSVEIIMPEELTKSLS